MVLGRAVVHQPLIRSPAAALPAPKVPIREMRILTSDDVTAVAEALPDRYRTTPLVAAYDMGLRFEEIPACGFRRWTCSVGASRSARCSRNPRATTGPRTSEVGRAGADAGDAERARH